MAMMKRTEPKFEQPQTNLVVHEVEGVLDAFIKGVNSEQLPAKTPREVTQFETLDHATGEAEIAAAQDLVTEAQNFLAETKARVEKKRLETEQWVREYQDRVQRQRQLSSTVLRAHQDYHNLPPATGES
jgi:outer membrane PBP1 activator LpoA protein